jgi:hypothetical protein
LKRQRIHFTNVYVSNDESHYDEDEIKRLGSELVEAQYWLQAQARPYRVDLQFVTDHHVLRFNNRLPKGPDDGPGDNWRGELVGRLGFVPEWMGRHFEDLFRGMQQADGDAAVFAVSLNYNVDGSCHARDIYVDKGAKFGVLFAYTLSHRSIYAHELLHIMGARDLYWHPQNERVLRGVYPGYSIMIPMSAPNLRESVVDPYTAWKIGWSAAKEPWFSSIRTR